MDTFRKYLIIWNYSSAKRKKIYPTMELYKRLCSGEMYKVPKLISQLDKRVRCSKIWFCRGRQVGHQVVELSVCFVCEFGAGRYLTLNWCPCSYFVGFLL